MFRGNSNIRGYKRAAALPISSSSSNEVSFSEAEGEIMRAQKTRSPSLLYKLRSVCLSLDNSACPLFVDNKLSSIYTIIYHLLGPVFPKDGCKFGRLFRTMEAINATLRRP